MGMNSSIYVCFFGCLPIENLQAKKHEAQSLTLHLTSLVIVHGVHILYNNLLSSLITTTI